MKKKFLLWLSAALLFAFAACNEPVFYTISQEVAPVPPLIDGSPTNFAVYKDALFVASGRKLFSYKGGKWNEPKRPGDKIKIAQIASTDKHLYALCYNDSSGKTELKRSGDAEAWTDIGGISGDSRIHYIDAAQDVLFVGAIIYNNNNTLSYNIFYLDEDDTGQTLIKMNCAGEINGVAWNGTNYFICTKGNGIYTTDNPSAGATLIPDTENIRFTGIISLENGDPSVLVAITRNGLLYSIGSGSESNFATLIPDISLGSRMSTGALAVWRQPGSSDDAPKLLLAGRQDRLSYTVDSGYTYGYLELELDSTAPNGIKSGSNFVEPGTRAPSTLDDNERFKSTIGKQPVSYIFQSLADIDSDMILFASTQLKGVWSYRDRDKGPQWNAEDNSHLPKSNE